MTRADLHARASQVFLEACELDGVARLLSAIESGPVDMAVTLLEINRKLGATRRPIPGRPIPPSNVVQPLTATMEVKTVMQETL